MTTHENFKFLATYGIGPGIKAREDSNPECGEARKEEVVKAYLRDPARWKEQVGHGQRWMAEAFFSGFKRLFDEVMQARKFERMVKEIELKVGVYNLMLGLTVALALSTAKG
jgi:hypothetical protein